MILIIKLNNAFIARWDNALTVQEVIGSANSGRKEEEIMSLRKIVHKLNSEVSRCQNKSCTDSQYRIGDSTGNQGDIL